MASIYLATNKINVFPSTRRVQTQTTARLMTEEAMVRIINQLIESDGFIISPSAFDLSAPLEFNIQGYYFNIATINDVISNFDSSTEVYAYIVIDTSNQYYYELKGQDINSEYQGLFITDDADWSSQDSDTITYKLKLFERETTSDTWGMAKESFVMFKDMSVDIDVDGGVVN